MSLWSDYIAECGIMQIIEEPWGFMTYEVKGDGLWIGDAYVTPEVRKSSKTEELLQRVMSAGKEQGCSYLNTSVNIGNEGAEEAMLSLLRRDFKVQSADAVFIYFSKLL